MITVEYTLVAAADSSPEQYTGKITEANDEQLTITRQDESKPDIELSERYGALHVYTVNG